MANYYGNTRTNYFRITNEEAFEKIIKNMASEDEVEVWEEEINGQKHYGFGACSTISYKSYTLEKTHPDYDVEDYDYDDNALYKALQTVVHPEDAIIITEVGKEKLRYLTAIAIVITQKHIQTANLYDYSLDCARKSLNNQSYKTQMHY